MNKTQNLSTDFEANKIKCFNQIKSLCNNIQFKRITIKPKNLPANTYLTNTNLFNNIVGHFESNQN